MKIDGQDVEGVVVEVIERTDDPRSDLIIPNEVRINGRPVLAPADRPVVVHEVSASARDVVLVTLTLFAKRVTFGTEPKADPDG